MRLHNYFRSSTSTRVRIALNLKGIKAEYLTYALLKREHKSDRYLKQNPAGLVPSLELDDGTVLTQSLAIIEYLDEVYPEPPLLPTDAITRAKARALAQMISLEIHPLNNLRVLSHISETYQVDDDGKSAWFGHWVHETFAPLEQVLSETAGTYCCGNTPSLPDLCLYAQVWNNKRFDLDMSEYPTIGRIFEALDMLDAFQLAAPPNQLDAV